MRHSRICYRVVGGEGGRQLDDDFATYRSGTPPGGKRQLIRGEGSGPQDPGGGVRLTAPRTDRFVLPVDTYDCGSGCEEQIPPPPPLPQGLPEWPVPRPAGDQSTRQSDRQPVEAGKVFTVLDDMAPEPVDSPVSAGLAVADGDTIGMLPLVRQAVLAGLNLCDSLVGGPTSTFLSSADGIVDLPGGVTISANLGVAPSTIAGVSYPTDLAGGVTTGVAPSAVIAEVASSAVAWAESPAEIAGVASLADTGAASWPKLLRWRPRPMLGQRHC